MTDSTDLDERRERPCGDLAQPHFDLKASDISSDLVVDFWIRAQREIRARIQEGYTLEQAVKMTRDYFFLQPYDGKATGDKKLDSAGEIAVQMKLAMNRKLAD